MVAGGEGWGRDNYGVWDGYVHTVIFKIDNQQGPTIAHGTLFNVIRQPG